MKKVVKKVMKRVAVLALAALAPLSLGGCGFPGGVPAAPGGDSPPGVVFDGGPAAAAYLGCREFYIGTGQLTPTTDAYYEQVCAQVAASAPR